MIINITFIDPFFKMFIMFPFIPVFMQTYIVFFFLGCKILTSSSFSLDENYLIDVTDVSDADVLALATLELLEVDGRVWEAVLVVEVELGKVK